MTKSALYCESVKNAIPKTVINCRDRLNFRLLQMGNLKNFGRSFPFAVYTECRKENHFSALSIKW